MRATEFISEVFSHNSGLPLEWEKSMRQHTAVARLPDNHSVLEVHFWTLPKDAVEIDFMLNGTYDLTKKGNQFLIFATVLNAIREYDDKYAPLYLIFSAKEANRKSLYSRMISKYASELGYTVGSVHDLPEAITNEVSVNPSDFVLIHKDVLVHEDMTRRGFLGGLESSVGKIFIM